MLESIAESGFFYSTFIDPILAPMRKRVAQQINRGESVIDLACGTGAQVFEMATVAKKVVGADLSESMIDKARKTLKKKNLNNVGFCLCDATGKLPFDDKEFDAATMSLALHQFAPEYHSAIIGEMKRIAKRIIFVDYTFPLPKNYVGTGSRVAEFFAGNEHHQNFKHYMRLGGLQALLAKNNLHIKNQEFFAKGAFHLVVCSE